MRSTGLMTRREFVCASAAAGGAAATLGEVVPGAKAGSGPAAGTDQKTVIHIVYLAKPVPTWPCPDIDLKAEMARIDAALTDLQGRWNRRIEFAGGELFRTADEVTRLRPALGEACGILAFNLTSGCGPMLDVVTAMGHPTVLFSQPYSGHDWATVADRIRRGQRIDVVASSDLADLEPFMRIFETVRRMRQTRLLCVQPKSREASGVDALQKHYGTTIELLAYAELNSLFQESDVDQATRLADQFIAGAVRMGEPSRQDVIQSMRLYLAIEKLLARHQASAITIDCLGGFNRGDLPAYPCVAWTLLNDRGWTGVCEADIETAMTQLLLQYLTGKPGFVSDPVIDTKTNTVIHAHCVSATRMDGPEGKPAPYIIRTHMEDNKGVSVQVKMRVGEPITLARLTNVSTMLISTGEIIDNPEGKRGCRTKVTTKVSDADRLLHSYTAGLHRVLVYGHHLADVRKLGRLLGLRVVEEI